VRQLSALRENKRTTWNFAIQ